jgi:putative nucleotidyltransferase with HDIG domain
MSPAAEEMFTQAARLPQVPHVLQEVLRSLRDEDVSIAELAALVGNDQVIAAKVLRLANSAYYGAGRKVASIADAVKLIGLKSFRNLVIASILVNTFPPAEGFDLPAFWRNSMLVANLSHILGQDLKVDREVLFSAGLMHAIGQLLIFLSFPEAARNAATACQGATLVEQRALERQLLGMDHFEVGSELARRWDFPESIQEAIARYDAPGEDDLPAQAVHAAVRIARGIQAGLPLRDMLADLPPALAARLHVDKAWFEEEGEVFDQLLREAALLA